MNKKCPYCGSYGVEILGLYWAYCPECGAEGPKMDTEQEAGAEWDRVVNAIKTDEGKVATDTDVGCKIPLPVKRDEKGPVNEKSVKELLAKIEEERLELIEALITSGIELDMASGEYCIGSDIMREKMADEWADMVTASVTFLDAIGIDVNDRAAAVRRCNERNRERGRL